MTPLLRRSTALILACIPIIAITGCTRHYYRESADSEVYRILQTKRAQALNDTSPFSIDPSGKDLLKDLPRMMQPLLPVQADTGPAAQSPTVVSGAPAEPPAIITLDKAIEIALNNSRDFQTNKEDLYLEALSLSGERHLWTPRFTGLISGQWQHAGTGDESWSSDGSFGIRQMIATGGQFTFSFATSAIRFITGKPNPAISSDMSATFVQPLLQGAGRSIAQEGLRQAERDVIYEARAFSRYNRTFAVSVAESYLRTLEQRQLVVNEWNNYQRLTDSRERAEYMAKAGRRAEFEVDQARQDELSARNRLVSAERQYWESLDSFKITLGLSTDANIDVDAGELQALMTGGIVHPNITMDAAVNQALALRLDLLTSRDRVADAERKVEVAFDSTKTELDFVASADIASLDRNQPFKYGPYKTGTYAAGLDLNLPFDRKLERNAFRSAQISLERARRGYAQLRDDIKLSIRRGWRGLQERRESYEIQKMSLDLAKRRVESVSLLLEAGRATTRDLLDAQAALLAADNALLGALIDHTVARLELWRDMETLAVSPEGTLSEQKPAAKVVE